MLKRGEEVPLTKTEFLLLCEFADHAGMVLSRDQLLERVWGYDYLGDSRLVDAHIRRLRVKIEDEPDDPKLVVTVRGIGYKLQTDPDVRPVEPALDRKSAHSATACARPQTRHGQRALGGRPRPRRGRGCGASGGRARTMSQR